MNRVSIKDNITFEIDFFSGLLEKNPGFIDAMVALADAYTLNGDFQKGLALDEKLSRILPDDPVIQYNLACSYSLLNDIDRSYRAIKKAISSGYDNLDHMHTDADLENLRKDVRFRRYFSRLLKKRGHRRSELFYEI